MLMCPYASIWDRGTKRRAIDRASLLIPEVCFYQSAIWWMDTYSASKPQKRYELWKGTLFLNTKENALYFTAWYTLQIMIFLFSICILFSRTFFNQEKQIDLCLLYIVSENWNPLYIVSEKYIYTVSENCTKIPNRPNIYNVITNKGKTTIFFLSHLTS